MQKASDYGIIAPAKTETPQPTTDTQLLKFLRRIQALTDGRHEIILTCDGGVKDWTVRQIGKVEK